MASVKFRGLQNPCLSISDHTCKYKKSLRVGSPSQHTHFRRLLTGLGLGLGFGLDSKLLATHRLNLDDGVVEDTVVGPLVPVTRPPLLQVVVPHHARSLAAHDALLLREPVPSSLRLQQPYNVGRPEPEHEFRGGWGAYSL